MTTDSDSIRARNVATLEKAFELLSTGRYADVGGLVTEDLLFELPYGPGRKPLEVRGRDAFVKLNAATWPAFSRFEIGITQLHPMLDPQRLVAEYQSDGEVKATGKPYLNRYVGIFAFRDGLVCEWHEFHNPDVPAEAFRADAG